MNKVKCKKIESILLGNGSVVTLENDLTLYVNDKNIDKFELIPEIVATAIGNALTVAKSGLWSISESRVIISTIDQNISIYIKIEGSDKLLPHIFYVLEGRNTIRLDGLAALEAGNIIQPYIEYEKDTVGFDPEYSQSNWGSYAI